MKNIVEVRVDERLIHGNIIFEWMAATGADTIVMLDDSVAKDHYMSNIYKAMTPIHLETFIFSVDEGIEFLKQPSENERILLLMRDPLSAERVFDGGVNITRISFADKMYFSNKVPVPEIYMRAINDLLERGIKLVAKVRPDETGETLRYFNLRTGEVL